MTKRITESQLRKIIAEAAQKILNEDNRSPLTDNRTIKYIKTY